MGRRIVGTVILVTERNRVSYVMNQRLGQKSRTRLVRLTLKWSHTPLAEMCSLLNYSKT